MNETDETCFYCYAVYKKLSDALQTAVFNDYDYRLLSSDETTSVADLKSFDKSDPDNKRLYNEKAYKIIIADKAMDLGFYEEKSLKMAEPEK